MSLEVRIWALRLVFGPQVWDSGLETEIWASRLGFEGGRRRRRKSPICVKAYFIDPFGAAAQNGAQPTDQPTDRYGEDKEQGDDPNEEL